MVRANGVVKTSGLFGAVVALALPVTAHFEGLKTRTYLDPVGIPTICYGETHNVKPGMSFSKEECDTMLSAKLGFMGSKVDEYVLVPLAPETHAALTSFMYNVGPGAFRKSTLLKKLNQGDVFGACNELPRWKYAGGRVLPGLVARRAKERQLCLAGARV